MKIHRDIDQIMISSGNINGLRGTKLEKIYDKSSANDKVQIFKTPKFPKRKCEVFSMENLHSNRL